MIPPVPRYTTMEITPCQQYISVLTGPVIWRSRNKNTSSLVGRSFPQKFDQETYGQMSRGPKLLMPDVIVPDTLPGSRISSFEHFASE